LLAVRHAPPIVPGGGGDGGGDGPGITGPGMPTGTHFPPWQTKGPTLGSSIHCVRLLAVRHAPPIVPGGDDFVEFLNIFI